MKNDNPKEHQNKSSEVKNIQKVEIIMYLAARIRDCYGGLLIIIADACQGTLVFVQRPQNRYPSFCCDWVEQAFVTVS